MAAVSVASKECNFIIYLVNNFFERLKDLVILCIVKKKCLNEINLDICF